MNPTPELDGQYRQLQSQQPVRVGNAMPSERLVEFVQQEPTPSAYGHQANASTALQMQRHQHGMISANGQLTAAQSYGANRSYGGNLQMSGPLSSTQYISSVNPYGSAQQATENTHALAGGSFQAYMASPASYSVANQQYTNSAAANNQLAQFQHYAADSTTTSQQQFEQRQSMSGLGGMTMQSGGSYGASTSQAAMMTGGGERYKSETRVVGHEYGEERVVSVTQRVDESRSHIVNERYVEHEVRVPKRIIREEIIEKVIVVPEKIIQEEIIEEMAKVQEKIVEYAKPIIVEKVVEQVEYEYVEKTIEVPQIVYQDRIRQVEKVIHEERIKEVPKIIQVEKFYDVPDIKYRDVPVERVVHVDDWRDEIIEKKIPVPQYVDQPVPNVVQVEKVIDVERNIPIPVEANISYEFRIPKIKPRYHKITYPVYLPRFIEVPVALELLQGGLLQQTEMYLEKVGSLTKAAASLCEIENLATTIMNADIQSKISTLDLQSFIIKSWKEGSLNVGGMIGGSMHSIASNNYSFAPVGNVGTLMNAPAMSGMLRVV